MGRELKIRLDLYLQMEESQEFESDEERQNFAYDIVEILSNVDISSLGKGLKKEQIQYQIHEVKIQE